MPVTFRAVSLRHADEETTPGVHCLNEIAVKDKPLPEVARTAERQCLCAEKEAQPVVRLELAHEWTKLWMPTIPWSADAHSVRGDLQNTWASYDARHESYLGEMLPSTVITSSCSA